MVVKRAVCATAFGGFVSIWAAAYAQTNAGDSAAVIATQAAVCRPQFRVDSKTYEAGTAFIVGSERPVLLTAQHLFGPDGGLKETIRWQDMPERARVVSCEQIEAQGEWAAGAAIAINGAHAMSPDDQSGSINDVAAFLLLNRKVGTSYLSLAASRPSTGSKVWLVAQVEGQSQGASNLHGATIIGFEDGAMLFAYDDPKINLDATSGAPIVDSSGKVVGLNLGGGYDAEAKTVVGVADDLQVLTKALETAKSG